MINTIHEVDHFKHNTEPKRKSVYKYGVWVSWNDYKVSLQEFNMRNVCNHAARAPPSASSNMHNCMEPEI